MKNISRFSILLFIVFIPFILGMGSVSEITSPENIPNPDKSYSVTFLDQMDVVTHCNNVSIEGKIFIEGLHGKGTFSIIFDKIDTINFLLKDEKLHAVISMKDQSNIELIVDKNAHAYGRTPYGTYQIKLVSLKKAVFK